MTDANTICHDVDLLGDWLSAKGYTEEAGLCLRVLGLIHEQAEENEKLRAALKQLHEAATEATNGLDFDEWWKEELDDAAAALKGDGYE